MMIVKSTLGLILLLSTSTLLELACEDSIVIQDLSQETEENLDDTPDETDEDSGEAGDRIEIVDRTGKKWDITHAVNKYGFEPDKFQFGLGPDAIKPILDPQMLCPGDPGYPKERSERDELFLVLGASINGHTRAYPLKVMSRHEVADEKFGDSYVAVAY